MPRKNLNIDKLYELSIEKWINNLELLLEFKEISYRELYRLICDPCFFCLDSIGKIFHRINCKKCKINKKICSKHANEGIISCFNPISHIAYSDIGRSSLKKREHRKAIYLTKQMIIALDFMVNKYTEMISKK